MAAASSSTQFFGIREGDSNQTKQQQQPKTSTAPTSSTAPSSAPQKKKRNLPGTPYPDAEVIALSPKTLMATNRFICEVCNKGFQREQNLQLHRRGHNLPWKLRQKSTKEVKRKVYLCPEPTCVHHDPSRALGDLTGIKKHFCRKHGEKKWKCEKCSKRYAVQSDWKAHSKTCGTREYRCDCGTLFSRRDSFITHRAFCDALAQESARLPTALNTMAGTGHHLYAAGRNTGLALSGQLSALQDHHQPTDLLRLGAATAQFDHLLPPTSAAFRPPHHPTSSPFFLPNFHHDVDHNTTSLVQTKPFSGCLLPMPDTSGSSSSSASAAAAAGLFNMGFFSNNSNNNIIGDQLSNGNGGGADAQATLFSGGAMIEANGGGHGHIPPLYNEPALPQMSATALLQKAAQMGATTSSNGGAFLRAFGSSSSSSNKSDRPPAASFLPATMRSQMETDNQLQDLMNSLANGAGSDGLTRDFLGVGGIMRSIGGEHGGGHGRRHGIDISSLDGDMKSKAGGMRPSFGGGSSLL